MPRLLQRSGCHGSRAGRYSPDESLERITGKWAGVKCLDPGWWVMQLSDISIRRPVFAVMLIGAIVVLGVVSIPRLGIDLWPRLDFPMVVVTTVLVGAAPATVEREVSLVLEEEINTIEGVGTLRSSSSTALSIVTRLRPVLMTTVSTLRAVMPPACGSGEGSEWRDPMSVIRAAWRARAQQAGRRAA